MSDPRVDPTRPMAAMTQPLEALGDPRGIGAWTIERKLGSGAMGDVFLARREDGARAALKLVTARFADDVSFTQRFEREIAVLAQADHPNVARSLDWGEHQGRPWLAMEYVEGPNLQSLLDAQGAFFEADVLHVAIQVARGLAHIHTEAGLIHRDVKPANILVARQAGGDPKRLLNPGDVAKLIDFGLAKSEDDGDQRLTMTGMIMGTPNYIAPEQVQCERNLDYRCDMYALGASVFHLLTGRPPFQAGSAAAVMAAHLNQPVPDPGELVPALRPATRALVRTSLAKARGDRFADWRAFIVACEKALRELGEGPASTGRILRKPVPGSGSRPGPGSERLRRETPPAHVPVASALTPRYGTPAPPPAASGSDALRQIATSKIIKVQTTSAVHRKAARVAPPQAPVPVAGPASAVYRQSGRMAAAGITGGSMLPWLVLGLAAAAAVAAVVYLR